MVKSKKRLFAVLAGALCIVVGAASMAFANEAPVGTAEVWFGDGLVRTFGLPGGAGLWSNADGTGFMGKAGEVVVTRKAAGIRLMNGAGEMGLASSENPRVVLAYIAGKTGTPLETLLQEIKDGKTLEEIAEAYGVNWAEIETAVACPGFPLRLSEERLQQAIEQTTENIDRMTERMETFESKLPEYEARIAEIEDETLREFAERHLDLLKRRAELGDDHLSIMRDRLDLLEDELDYSKSR